jgi:hypothetical protein
VPRKDPTPWRTYQTKHPGDVPGKDVLAKWRKQRRALAKSAGARFVCDICGRPLHRYGYVWLRTPRAWRVRPRKRSICFACYTSIDVLLDQMEATQAREHLPPEGNARDPEQDDFDIKRSIYYQQHPDESAAKLASLQQEAIEIHES